MLVVKIDWYRLQIGIFDEYVYSKRDHFNYAYDKFQQKYACQTI